MRAAIVCTRRPKSAHRERVVRPAVRYTSAMRPKQRITIAALEPSEAAVLRLLLEYDGYEVRFRQIGRPRDLAEALSDEAPDAGDLIIACHGDAKGIVLPDLHPAVAAGEPFREYAGPEQIRKYAHLGGRVVVCTGCSTGSEELARAFLDAGASAFIAPSSEPEDAVFFLAHLYRRLRRGSTLSEAVAFAQSHDDPDARAFRLFLSASPG